MRILNNKSGRFNRSLNYTVPEYRTTSLHSGRTRLSLVAPNHPTRGKESNTSEATTRN
jgi:hypothetical protein